MKTKKLLSLSVSLVLVLITSLFISCDKEENDNTVTDIDGNTYKTVTIGNQIWMAENLRTTTFNDGTPMSQVEDRTTWADLTTEAYCWYNNDEATFGETYGALYNYYAVDSRKLCPDGWRVASPTEWNTLRDYLADNGHKENEGTALKSINGWENDGSGTDDYGFKAIPGGSRAYSFEYMGRFSYWWAHGEWSGHIIAKYLVDQRSDISQIGTVKAAGYSVRCISY